nr:unnamed protein product [Spirometra erinaceieuropaei]
MQKSASQVSSASDPKRKTQPEHRVTTVNGPFAHESALSDTSELRTTNLSTASVDNSTFTPAASLITMTTFDNTLWHIHDALPPTTLIIAVTTPAATTTIPATLTISR